MGTSLSETITSAALVFLAFASVLAVVFRRSHYIILLYCMVLFLFTSTSIGATEKIILIYDRGVGALPITILNIYLIVVFVYFFGLRIFSRYHNATESFRPGRRIYILLVFCILYLLFGVATDIPIREILSSKGIINIINMCLLISILMFSIKSSEILNELKNFSLFCLFISALYGFIRYILFGGDPANLYANVENLDVRLTYVDIGNSILFGFSFSYSVLKLLKERLSDIKSRVFFISLSFLSLFNIIFSYRRTAWAGLLILLIWIILILEFKKKLVLIIVAFISISVIGTYVISKRFTGKMGVAGYSTIYGDITSKGEVSVTRGRFSELNNAIMATLKDHPLLGFGPWGRYSTRAELGNFAYFTHSSVVHMLFKTGVIGLYLFFWPLISLALWTITRRKLFPKGSKFQILSDSAFGGILFSIPDILFGTPIIIYRHFQILGFFIAVIYCSYVFRNAGTNRETHIIKKALRGNEWVNLPRSSP
jgi:O-Antigen ligase